MAEKTAVDWLFEQIPVEWSSSKSAFDAFQQAKQMEKKQIIDSFGVGCQVESKRLIGYHEMAQQYYNENFGK